VGRFAADPPRSDIRDETSELAKGLLRELTDAFRERQKFGSGGTRSPSGVAVERIKLLATFFNTVAAGLLTAGLIGPMAAFLFGFSVPIRLTQTPTTYRAAGSPRRHRVIGRSWPNAEGRVSCA
jgi:hypothetical protein